MRNKFYSRLKSGCSEQSEIDYHAMNASRIEADSELPELFPNEAPLWVLITLMIAMLIAAGGLAYWIATP